MNLLSLEETGMNTRSDFFLTKWYLDCVADNGEIFIGYSAALQWKLLNIHYTSILNCSENSGVHTETSLRENSFPQVKDSHIHWLPQLLNVEGTWEALAPPIHRQLYRTPDGAIDWFCLQPYANVDVQMGSRGNLKGKGYVERIEISIKPWELPINEMRWGRFHSETDVLVWIQWKGKMQQTLLFRNGVHITGSSITDEKITFDNGQTVLTFSKNMVLRKGPLVSTALSVIPGIAMVVPAKILQADESKWCSRGCLTRKDTPATMGWAIHEVVRFP